MVRVDAMIRGTFRHACALMMAGWLLVPASAAPLATTDDPAPNVELRGPKGQRQRLVDFRGKIVLLKIWASWCPDCKVMFPELDRLSREFKSQGVEVIAVNVDEQRKDADAFLKTQDYELRVMFDPRGRVASAFAARGVPASFLIDARGMIRFAHEGWDETADATYRQEIATLLKEWRGSSNRN
jgi:peroxiredoxin